MVPVARGMGVALEEPVLVERAILEHRVPPAARVAALVRVLAIRGSQASRRKT